MAVIFMLKRLFDEEHPEFNPYATALTAGICSIAAFLIFLIIIRFI